MAADARVELKDEAIRAALARLAASLPTGGDATPAMRGVGRALLTGVQLRFRSGKGPDGVPWKKSLRAATQGGQTLRDSGILANSFSYQAENGSVAIGTNDIKAAIHHFGGAIRAKAAGALHFRLPTGQAVTVKSVTMPERPILGVSDSDRVEVLRVLEEHYQGRWSS